MAYLAKSDYSLRIAIDHLDEILAQAAQSSGLTADQVLANAEALATAQITAYLKSKYKIAAEFGVTGAGRGFLIVKWMIDLALYSIHLTVNPRDVPEIREKMYLEAVDELKGARDAMLDPNISQVDPFYSRIVIASGPKFNSKEFDEDFGPSTVPDPTFYE